MTPEQAEAMIRIARSPDGRVLLALLEADFDKAMRRVLYCEEQDLSKERGHARALHENLSLFVQADQTIKTIRQRGVNGYATGRQATS